MGKVGKSRFPGGTPGIGSSVGVSVGISATLPFPPISPKVRKRANRGVGRVRERHFWTSEKDVQKCPPGPSQTTPSLTLLFDFPQTSRNGRVGSQTLPGGMGGIPPPSREPIPLSAGRPLAGPLPNPGLGGSGPTLRKGPKLGPVGSQFSDPHFSEVSRNLEK